MRATTAAFAIAAAAATVSGQTVHNYTSALDMEIDPNSVTVQERASWCQGQTNTCNVLCESDTASNDCLQATLDYSCTCSSNNSAPGLEWYSQTIPFYVCRALFSQCTAQNVGDADAQEACEEDINSHCFDHPATAADVEESDDDESSTTSSAPSSTATEASETSGTAAAETTGPSDNDNNDSAGAINVPGSGAAAIAALGLLAALL